jgi:hypothetical protein
VLFRVCMCASLCVCACLSVCVCVCVCACVCVRERYRQRNRERDLYRERCVCVSSVCDKGRVRERGLISPTCLCTCSFKARSSQNCKNSVKLSVSFALLGSVQVKDLRKMLVKLAHGVTVPPLSQVMVGVIYISQLSVSPARIGDSEIIRTINNLIQFSDDNLTYIYQINHLFTLFMHVIFNIQK